MLAIEKRADVSEQLSYVYRNRLQQGRLPEGHNELRAQSACSSFARTERLVRSWPKRL
jgi:hypothetical protein